ncbi:hypothetical protein [Nostoc sp. CHAB 5715]|uniref:hypothetical protein n=1 Tax=Nostoc sp. CHAB 5715 TaxID=2780400 RepID=UPI001E5E30CC|nr:hypothetical protein [Nostoc sp. CHAB 5715]MCC5620434.1 hypothetical protein [Nostoc sp. CHAB 5715]
MNKETIQQLLRKELMQESVTYQALIAEGRAEGRAKGIEEGIEEGIRRVAINLLREGMSVEVVVRVTGLSVEQINQIKITEVDSQGE